MLKTRTWIILFVMVLVICAGFCLRFFMGQQDADSVRITSDAELLYTLPLNTDREVVITSQYGTNTVTVRDGAVAVTQADCPDHYCMNRGFCKSGAQIVCLPNRLVLTFIMDAPEVDGVAG